MISISLLVLFNSILLIKTSRNMRYIIVCLVVIASMLHVESTFFCANTCPTDNAPICARQYLLPSNQQTFSNICQLQVYNYNNWANQFYQVASGACPTGAVTCSTTCDTTYAPVTGYELGNIFAIRSFNNPCELINYNCAPTGRAVVQTAPIIPCPTYAF